MHRAEGVQKLRHLQRESSLLQKIFLEIFPLVLLTSRTWLKLALQLQPIGGSMESPVILGNQLVTLVSWAVQLVDL